MSKKKTGRFADILPSPAEQDAKIREHEGILKVSLENTFQILTPPVIDGQAFPTRVFFNEFRQEIFLDTPRKSKWFWLKFVLIHFPPDLTNDLPGPPLFVQILSLDKKYTTDPIDVRNFTTPNVDPDPLAASPADQSQISNRIPIDRLFPADENLRIVFTGWNGTNPEWVDLIGVGRCLKSRKLMDDF